MGVYINHLAYALGEHVETVEEAAEAGFTLSTAEILRESGFERHHRCHPETDAYQLARQCVSQIPASVLKKTGSIIYANCLPGNANMGDIGQFIQSRDVKHLMDFPASHLQSEFHMDEANIIGLNQQACTGMLGSLRLASALLQVESELESVLCVTADRFPEEAIYEQAYNLISDGAAACVVSREPAGFLLESVYHKTNGALAQASDDETVGTFFNNTHQVIARTLEKAKLTIRDINWVVPQNTNAKAWQILSRLLGFKFERVYFPSIAEAGHVISGDNIINLKRLDESGELRSGDRILMMMAGFGLNWQCVILRKV